MNGLPISICGIAGGPIYVVKLNIYILYIFGAILYILCMYYIFSVCVHYFSQFDCDMWIQDLLIKGFFF